MVDLLVMKLKYLFVRQLFREFVVQYLDYKGLYSLFDYIFKVCNVVIYGQKILEGYVYEVIYMGLKMFNEFEYFDK